MITVVSKSVYSNMYILIPMHFIRSIPLHLLQLIVLFIYGFILALFFVCDAQPLQKLLYRPQVILSELVDRYIVCTPL